MGETASGIITTFHYMLERDDPMNNAFVAGYRAANNGRSPDLFSIGGYDGMHLIYAALEKTGGDAGGDAAGRGGQGHGLAEPARADVDRPRDPRRDPDRLHPRGAGGRTASCRTSSSRRSRT